MFFGLFLISFLQVMQCGSWTTWTFMSIVKVCVVSCEEVNVWSF